MKLSRVAAALAIVAVAMTTASCTRHNQNKTATTTSASTAPGPILDAAAGRAGERPAPAPVRSVAWRGSELPVPADQRAGRANRRPRHPRVRRRRNPPQIGLTIVTDRGRIGLQLANNESPCTVTSFVSLAQQAYFDNTECHRLTTARALSVLQCGDPKGDGTGGPGYQFANEYPTAQYRPGDPALQQPVVYPRGTVAMANAGPGTNGSQFFMVYRDSLLPPNYTVFGTINPSRSRRAGQDRFGRRLRWRRRRRAGQRSQHHLGAPGLTRST